MLHIFRKWMGTYFADEEAVLLLFILIIGFALILTLGNSLAPVIASIVFAFLIHGLLALLLRYGCPSVLAFTISFVVFASLFLGSLLILLPLVWKQMQLMLSELPGILQSAQDLLILILQKYPEFVSEQQILDWANFTNNELAKIGQVVLSLSLSTLPNIFAFLLYLILIPILVFFFLKDRQLILNWLGAQLPTRRPLLYEVWNEMKAQIANYIRGKAIEILIVGSVTYITFALLGLKYAAFLAVVVGLSVVIPYIGAVVVTLPVLMVSYFQWGWTDNMFYLVLTYGVIQALDGNVLVPLLFSEAVNLHPTIIIVAVLIFGSFWGVWGVFFAIPLATLFKAVFNAWPRAGQVQSLS